MAHWLAYRLAALCISSLRGLIGYGDDPLPVRAKTCLVYLPILMAHWRTERLAGLCIPYLYRYGVRYGDNSSANPFVNIPARKPPHPPGELSQGFTRRSAIKNEQDASFYANLVASFRNETGNEGGIGAER